MHGLVVLLVEERVGARDEHDRLAAVEPAHLGCLDEVALRRLPARAPPRRRAARVALRHGGHRLLADRLGDLLVRLGRLPPEEQNRVAAVDDRLGVVSVRTLELRDGLQNGRDRDVAAADDGHGLLHVGHAADVGELVEDEAHRGRQAPAVLRQCAVAEQVEGLPHEHRVQERVGAVGVRHDREQGAALPPFPHPVDGEVVGREEAPRLLDRQGREARVARDDDRLEGLARRRSEGPVPAEREVLLGGARVRGPHPPDPSPLVVGARVASRRRRGADAPHPRLYLVEEQVERASERLVVVPRLREPEQRQHPGDRPVPLGAVVHEVRHERRVEQLLRCLPERVVGAGLGVGGVEHEAVGEPDDVRLAPEVRDRVVAVAAGGVDGVEDADLVAAVLEQPPHVHRDRPLRVGDEVGRVHLHEVGLDEAAGLARPRAPDDEDVAGALEAPVVVLPAHRERAPPRQDDVLPGV